MTEAAAFAPGRTVRRMGTTRHWQLARVVEVRTETPTARTLRLAVPGREPHLPGQHYSVRLTAPDGYTAQRDYSVGSAPDDDAVEITVDRAPDGEVSGHLVDVVEPGDLLEVRGPFGGYFTWTGEAPALLVAGGSGVVPLMSMVRHRRRRGLAVDLHLVVSVRTPADLFYRDEMTGEDVDVVYSREAPEGSTRPAGRLTPADLAPHVARGADAYVCGSNAFADAAARLLMAAGQPYGAIRIERFGSGVAELPCPVGHPDYLTVRCHKRAGHPDRGDPVHEHRAADGEVFAWVEPAA